MIQQICKMTFLNGDIKEEVYLKILAGYELHEQRE